MFVSIHPTGKINYILIICIVQAEASATSAKEETAHYKKLTETLKQKLRSLSDQSGDNQTFLDTFEEVPLCCTCTRFHF